MRNSHGGEGRAASQVVPRQEAPDVMGKSIIDSKSAPLYSDSVRPSVAAQCYNCHTTATPLWRKDDEGKTVCNAYVFYFLPTSGLMLTVNLFFRFCMLFRLQVRPLLQAARLCSPDFHEVGCYQEAF